MTIDADVPPLSGPARARDLPARRPGSVRRTSHLDVTAQDSLEARHVASVEGAARDLLTDADGGTTEVGTARIRVQVGADGLVAEATAAPDDTATDGLIGHRLGPGFRAAIGDALERHAGRPLSLLLNDLVGSPAPMRYGLMQRGVAVSGVRRQDGTPVEPPGTPRTGFNCAARRGGPDHPLNGVLEAPPAPDLDTTAEALAWHPLSPPRPGQGRRRRLVDVWMEGDDVAVEAFFRDTNARHDDGREVIVHEYGLRTRLARDGTILAMEADPHVLPQHFCPWAAPHVATLVGQSIHVLGRDIHSHVTGEDACTHLNDMIRFLADAPAMAEEHLAAR
jgi:hypothetical protein